MHLALYFLSKAVSNKTLQKHFYNRILFILAIQLQTRKEAIMCDIDDTG